MTAVNKAEMLRKIRELRDEFRWIAQVLEKHNHNVKITRVAGGTAGVVGGGMAVGLILVPFTGGVSLLVVGITGMSLGIAGAVTSAGGFFVGLGLKRRHMKRAEAKWKAFREKFKKYLEEWERERDPSAGDCPKSVPFSVAAGYANAFRAAAAAGTRGAPAAGRSVGAAFASTVSILNFIAIGVSVYDIVQGARELHNETVCSSGRYIRELVDELNDLAERIEKDQLGQRMIEEEGKMSDCLIPVSKQELLEEIREFKEEILVTGSDLDKHNDNVKITRVTGGTAGFVGGGMSVCLVAASFTAGISLIVVGGIGAGLCLAGSVTTFGGWGIGKLIQWRKLRKIERKRKDLEAKLQDYCKKKLKEYKSMPDSVGDEFKKWHKIWMAFRFIDGADEIVQFIATGKLIVSGTQTAATAGQVAVAFLKPTAILTFVGMGLSAYDMVQGAKEIHKKTKSPAGDYLRKLTQQIDEQDLVELVEKP